MFWIVNGEITNKTEELIERKVKKKIRISGIPYPKIIWESDI